MDGERSRWNLVREQLTSLWTLDSKSPSAKELETLLIEEISKPCMNLKVFNHICYFLLGFINKEERDKLIKWPIVSAQGNLNFRKGVSKIVKDLTNKYSHLNVKKLPDSYLIDPSQNQEKILDFIIRLSNVAIFVALDDPYLFSMTGTSNLSGNEIEIATNTIKEIRLDEEQEIQKHEFPLVEFDSNWSKIVNKCVALKEANYDLMKELSTARKYVFEKGIFSKENYDFNCLKVTYEEKLKEQKDIISELLPYCKLGEELVKNISAVENPVQLTKEDFGLGQEPDFTAATTKAYDRLTKTFEFIKSRDVDIKLKVEYYKSLVNLKKTLMKEKDALRSFIHKFSGFKTEKSSI